MSPLSVKYGWACVALCLLSSFDSSAQDAIATLVPTRWVAGQSLSAERSGRLSGVHSESLAIDLYHRNVDQGISTGGIETSRLQATWNIPKQRSMGESFALTGTIEDDREGNSLQRFRLVLGGFSKIRLDNDRFILGGVRIGYGQRNWLNQGIWDSQYLANPAQPVLAESGEGRLENTNGYLETGLELGMMSRRWTVAYAMQNTPVDQGFYAYTTDAYTTQHRVLLAHRTSFQMGPIPFKSLSWMEWQRQGPASFGTVGTSLEFQIGEDSRLTEFKSASAIGAGLLYRTTGQLSPVVSCNFLRKYTVWLAPDWGIGPLNVQTGWTVGGRFVLSS